MLGPFFVDMHTADDDDDNDDEDEKSRRNYALSFGGRAGEAQFAKFHLINQRPNVCLLI